MSELFDHLIVCIHNRGVILVNYISDIGVRKLGDLTDKIDSHLSCPCYLLGTLLALDILFGNAVFVINGGEYLVHRGAYGLSTAEKLGKALIQ